VLRLSTIQLYKRHLTLWLAAHTVQVVGINALCNAAYVLMDVVFNKLLGEAGTVEEGLRPPTQQQDKQQQRQQHQERLLPPSSARIQELSLQALVDSGFGLNIPQAVRDLCTEGPKAYNRGLYIVQVRVCMRTWVCKCGHAARSLASRVQKHRGGAELSHHSPKAEGSLPDPCLRGKSI